MRPATVRTLCALSMTLLIAPAFLNTSLQAQAPAGLVYMPKLTLDDCISLGMQYQPTIAAATASLAAAQDGLASVQNLGRMARCLSKDIPIREEQAKRGVMIATAGLVKAQWDTRYAVTRNFFSVVYAREQAKVVKDVVDKLRQDTDIADSLTRVKGQKITTADVVRLKIHVNIYKTKAVEAAVGEKKALAALREAIGLGCNYCIDIDDSVGLPEAVEIPGLCDFIAMALSRRGEMAQAALAYQVTSLEVEAQAKKKGMQVKSFAASGDVHASGVPQGVSNKEYRPDAIGLEMPPYISGKKPDRIQRTQDFQTRAGAVVAKAQNLITLETEAMYYKWQEAYEELQLIEPGVVPAQKLLDNVRILLDQKVLTSTEDLLKSYGLSEQTRAQRNQARYHHVLALAALERVTAGGFRPLLTPTGRGVEMLPPPKQP